MAIYIGLIIADDGVVAKINENHHLTLDEVRSIFQWPARPLKVWFEDSEPHGPRQVALGVDERDRRILIALDPVPSYAGETSDTWSLRTAFRE